MGFDGGGSGGLPIKNGFAEVRRPLRRKGDVARVLPVVHARQVEGMPFARFATFAELPHRVNDERLAGYETEAAILDYLRGIQFKVDQDPDPLKNGIWFAVMLDYYYDWEYLGDYDYEGPKEIIYRRTSFVYDGQGRGPLLWDGQKWEGGSPFAQQNGFAIWDSADPAHAWRFEPNREVELYSDYSGAPVQYIRTDKTINIIPITRNSHWKGEWRFLIKKTTAANIYLNFARGDGSGEFDARIHSTNYGVTIQTNVRGYTRRGALLYGEAGSTFYICLQSHAFISPVAPTVEVYYIVS